MHEFPYLQPARAILLKALYNKESYRYNSEIKKAAAYTTDRSVLFDYITSENFQSIQKTFFEDRISAISDIDVKESEPVQPESSAYKPEEVHIVETLPDSEPVYVNEIREEESQHIIAEEKPSIEESLEIGKPLEFGTGEKHSFREWLQLSKMAPIKRDSEPETVAGPEPENALEAEAVPDDKSRKLELIDRFIETNPKITPAKDAPPTPISLNAEHKDATYLMTETLARVYLEQKKYTRAIQAYEILILKYPEKSVFFADRISDIKLLQQNNNS